MALALHLESGGILESSNVAWVQAAVRITGTHHRWSAPFFFFGMPTIPGQGNEINTFVMGTLYITFEVLNGGSSNRLRPDLSAA